MRKKGQIWVETVLYTLIGLALIGLVLAFVTPRIQKAKDELVVEQTIESLNVFDEKINAILEGGAGNVRNIDFTMRQGEFVIYPRDDEIRFVLKNLKKPYSEPGEHIEIRRMDLLTEEEQKTFSVTLTLSYEDIADLTYDGGNAEKQFNAASTPYRFSIENKGVGGGSLEIIDIKEISG